MKSQDKFHFFVNVDIMSRKNNRKFALEKKTFSSAFYLIRKTLIRCSYSPAFFDMLNKRSGVGSTLGNYS